MSRPWILSAQNAPVIQTRKEYLEKREEWSPKALEDMINFSIQLVRLEQGSPSLENRVRNLEHTNVGGRVVRLKSGNKVLQRNSRQQLSNMSPLV